MPLDSILVREYESARDRLLLRLRQESTQQPAYGGPMVELYPETGTHGSLSLMANGELVDKLLMMGWPGPSGAEDFVQRYISDFHKEEWKNAEEMFSRALQEYVRKLDETVYPLPKFPGIPHPDEADSPAYKEQMAEYNQASDKRRKDPRYVAFIEQNPQPKLFDFLLRLTPQTLLDEALKEGARIMSEALDRETYKQMAFIQVTKDQIQIQRPE